ncbi:glycosyltransferase family 2 protein [Alteromonas antoniana]|uniref:glycosyltransferase family 2 protein n=1 Tax=Alteromonas antoniana TaxID=2803813 RepID=UPI001C48FD66|nr:glycosyltransferase family 2 protein [Alteromonas antoniana]
MKKIAMRTVKGVAGLLPKSLKNHLKKNAKLTELYSTGIRKSGLFYGVPSKKVQKRQYQRFLARQELDVSALLSREPLSTLNCNIIFVGGNTLNIEKSLSSLKQAAVHAESLVLIAPDNDNISGVNTVDSLSSALSQLDSTKPVLLVRCGDTFHSGFGALYQRQVDHADVVYCDTDSVDKHGKYVDPCFLPDWNPDLQLSTGYIRTGVLCSKLLLDGLMTSRCNSISALIAYIAIENPEVTFKHLPYTVLHSETSQQLAIDALAINDMQKVVGKDIESSEVQGEVNRCLWSTSDKPLVSLIIPTKDGRELVKACIESIIDKSTYLNYEILLIDNGSTEVESLEYFEFLKTQPKIRVLNYPGPFNYSAINNFGVKHAKGDVIGLINNDIEVISPRWLDYMVGHALRKDIGCVGAKLLYSDGRIQHAGVVLGYGGGAGHAHKYFPRYHPGYLNRLAATQNYSAVTAACLLVRKSLFEEVGGLNEKDLAVAFNDVDFCLRIRELGKRNVYCAEAELFHHESVSRGLDIAPEKAARFNRELAYLQNRWANVIAHDPAYSPNLTLRSENFAIKEEREYISSSDS